MNGYPVSSLLIFAKSGSNRVHNRLIGCVVHSSNDPQSIWTKPHCSVCVEFIQLEHKLYSDFVHSSPIFTRLIDKLPSEKSKFYRGLGDVPDWFDSKHSTLGKVHETHFASVRKNYLLTIHQTEIIIFESDNVKDISALAIETNFAKYIGKKPTSSEYLIQVHSRFIVTEKSGKYMYLRSVK